MNCSEDDLEAEIGMLQHTLDAVIQNLHDALNRGEYSYVSLHTLVDSHRALETLMARLGIDADTQRWLSSERRDSSSQDYGSY